MRKGKLGISLQFLAGLSFMLVFFGQYLLVGLLLGLVMVAEKDEWLTRQCIQAFGLSFFYLIGNSIANALSGLNTGLLAVVVGPLSIVFGVLSLIIIIPAIVFTIMGWVRAAKGQEARLPIVGKWADKAMGLIQPAYQQQGGYPQQGPPQGGYPQQAPTQGGYAQQTQQGGYPQQGAPQQAPPSYQPPQQSGASGQQMPPPPAPSSTSGQQPPPSYPQP